MIYIGSQDHHLYVLNEDGSLRWRYTAGGEVHSPAIDVNGVIYVGANDGWLYALYPDGGLKWRRNLGGWLYNDPVIGKDNMLYINDFGGQFYALGDSTSDPNSWLLYLPVAAN